MYNNASIPTMMGQLTMFDKTMNSDTSIPTMRGNLKLQSTIKAETLQSLLRGAN